MADKIYTIPTARSVTAENVRAVAVDLRDNGKAITAGAVAAALGCEVETAQAALDSLAEDGKLELSQ